MSDFEVKVTIVAFWSQFYYLRTSAWYEPPGYFKGSLKSKMKYRSSESIGFRNLKYIFKNFFRPLTFEFELKRFFDNCTLFCNLQWIYCTPYFETKNSNLKFGKLENLASKNTLFILILTEPIKRVQ